MSAFRRRERDRAAASPDGSAVLVTGASSGIGRATALGLAERGTPVALLSRSEPSLREVESECRAAGVDACVLVADVADGTAVERAFDQAAATLGPLRGVVHAAGALAYGRFEDVPADVFEGAIATTLGGTVNVSRTALAHFRSQGDRGSLVLLGSLLGKIATPYMSSYVTAKWGVHGFARALQVEVRDSPNISVSLVTPGSVDTPVFRQAGTYTGVTGRPPPPIVIPERVADVAIAALDQPVRERNVGLTNPLVVFGFRALPGVFDALVRPLMRVGGLSRERSEATPGNVLEPRPSGEQLRGGWRR